MTVFKTAEIAAKLGIRPQTLNTLKARGKVIITGGKFDDQNPINKYFLESRNAINLKTVDSEQTVNTQTQIIINKKSEESETTRELSLLTKLKSLSLKEDIRSKKINIDIKEGKLVPTEPVKKILGEIVNRYKTMYSQQTEQLLRDTLNELQADNKQITEACSKLTDISNESTKRSIQEIRLNLRNIVSESILK